MNKPKALVIVDVQKGLSPHFNEEYLQKVKKFVENETWDKVIVRYLEDGEITIFDELGGELYTYDDGQLLPPFLINKNYLYSAREFGYRLKDQDYVETLIKDELWKGKKEGEKELWYFSNSPNMDKYCPTREIEALIHEDIDIHVIGGFRYCCVEEVTNFLKLASNNNITVHHELCYDMSYVPKIRESFKFTKNWVEHIDVFQ